MKWLKKIKKWFQDEEIIEIEEIMIDEEIDKETLKKMDLTQLQKLKEQSVSHEELTSTRLDPDTRILFQYPKGEFKFPIIPDNKIRQRRPKKPDRPINKERNTKHWENSSEIVYKQPEQPEKKKQEAAPKITKIVPSKIPFRPTEIPSPIYGYKRPEPFNKTRDDIVEYELENTIELSVSDPIETKATLRKNDREEREEEHGTIADSEFKEQEVTEDVSELIDANDEKEKNERSTDLIKEEEKTVLEEISFDTTAATIESLVPKAEETERMTAATAVYERESSDTMTVVEPSLEQEHFVQPKPTKKHIPFNVIMLKQDKEKVDRLKTFEAMRRTIVDDQNISRENVEPVSEVKFEQDVNEIHRQAARVITKDLVESKSDVHLSTVQSLVHTEEPVKEVIPENLPTVPLEMNLQDQIVSNQTISEEENPYYAFPSIDLLTPAASAESDNEWLEGQTALLDDTLKNFNVRAKVVNVTQGPAVTRFEVQPEPGVKVNKVTNLMDDIKLSLAAQDIRMEAPIPGKHTIGIEIPNRKSMPVFLREILESDSFKQDPSPLTVALGLDISGEPIVTDLKKMPHGLIAGATGSGKSVCINSMLISLLYKATPQEVKLLLIDPKMVELAPYNRLPHLVSPVITDVKAATAALKWAVEEMERRYELFVHAGVRDIGRFNENAEAAGQHANKLPFIVIIIDELADLMMMSPADVEEAISRIAQKARACGIHLIVATQRPSVDVITGLIKANIPTRIAFSVSSQVDSRTILDSGGAEKLLGRGDMLFAENGSSKSVRLQGTFVTDHEIDEVVHHVKNEQQPQYLFEQEELLNKAQFTEEIDELFFESCEFVVSQNAASTSSLQRRFKIGYNRAARLMEMMHDKGIISESRGSKPRDVLITAEELESFLEENAVM
ncbi:DNA translocase FtsK [Peribacillus sp. NPDC096379]|uniref:DNA translocase FtsK n=1 Tax=Peribacillus sp. NPDC096379 TaxID=3364393 RepID=UPI00380AAD42